MLFAILTNIVSLSKDQFIIATNSGSERIVLIALHFLEDRVVLCSLERSAPLLVGVKYDVVALRNIVAVHGHTLEVVRTIYSNTNLSIASIAQGNIVNSSTKLNDAILV